MDKINIDVITKFSHLLATEIENDNFEAIIVDTIYNSKRKLTKDTLADAMHELFNVSVDTMKVQINLKKLKKNNKINYENNYIVLTSTTLEDLTNIIDENEIVQNSALQSWIIEFEKDINEKISQEHYEVIKETIIKYINGFFLIHGADSFALFTGISQYDSIDVKELIEHSIQEVPEKYATYISSFLEKIFTSELTSQQKRFCIKQINKAVAYLSTVADDFIVEKVEEKIRGITIYLDTPILYRLLNLQGEGRFLVITSLINYCRENQIELKVFNKTIEELRRRIQYDAKLIEKYEYPISFASIGYKCRTTENYLSTYWKAKMDTGISAKDFNYRYKDLAGLITELQIIIDTDNYIEKCNLKEQIDLLYGKVATFSAKDPEYSKSDNSIDHDAVCLAIIEHLRIPTAANAFDSKVMFLTSDWSLVRLQKFDSEYQNKPDLVILPSQLMQLFCITHSSDKYYETFLGLFSSSRTIFGTNKLSNHCIQDILGRISYYKGVTPEFAEKILCNQLIQDTFNLIESETEQLQLIDDVMLSEVELMEQELKAKEEMLATAEVINGDKNNIIEDLSCRIKLLEDTNEKKDGQLRSNNKYQIHFEKSIEKKAKRKAICRITFGWAMIAFTTVCILICILAFIPITSGLVEPIFDYISTSKTIKQDSVNNLAIIDVVVSLSSIISGITGSFLISPGYNKIKNTYLQRYHDSLNDIDNSVNQV
ncbi:hypothetical protein ACOAOT_16785 [Lacrimispora sp. AGF001]|uniref:hypothetical protein n=1 Tax=Lacrimispora sp. AGF001 TaxID=3401631 RepID=UPI003B432DD9